MCGTKEERKRSVSSPTSVSSGSSLPSYSVGNILEVDLILSFTSTSRSLSWSSVISAVSSSIDDVFSPRHLQQHVHTLNISHQKLTNNYCLSHSFFSGATCNFTCQSHAHTTAEFRHTELGSSRSRRQQRKIASKRT